MWSCTSCTSVVSSVDEQQPTKVTQPSEKAKKPRNFRRWFVKRILRRKVHPLPEPEESEPEESGLCLEERQPDPEEAVSDAEIWAELLIPTIDPWEATPRKVRAVRRSQTKPHINCVPSSASQENVAMDERRQWTQTDKGTQGAIAWQNQSKAFDRSDKRTLGSSMRELYPQASKAAWRRRLPQIRQIEILKLEAGLTPGLYIGPREETRNTFRFSLAVPQYFPEQDEDSDSSDTSDPGLAWRSYAATKYSKWD